MPKPPLIASPRLRSGVVAALMIALLALSLGAASLITGAPLVRPQPAAAPPVDLLGASLAPPPGWMLAQTYNDSAGHPAGWELVNTSAAGQRLRIFRLTVPPAARPPAILQSVLPQLVQGRIVVTPLKTPEQGPVRENTYELFFSTQRQNANPDGAHGSPQIHAVAVLRSDPQRCWVIQLTELVPSERWSPDAEAEALKTLRRIMTRVTVNPV